VAVARRFRVALVKWHPGTCDFPGCSREAVTINRAEQWTCAMHYLVVVTGSWVDDGHLSGGHG
jgi:hypothetical protein